MINPPKPPPPTSQKIIKVLNAHAELLTFVVAFLWGFLMGRL